MESVGCCADGGPTEAFLKEATVSILLVPSANAALGPRVALEEALPWPSPQRSLVW